MEDVTDTAKLIKKAETEIQSADGKMAELLKKYNLKSDEELQTIYAKKAEGALTDRSYHAIELLLIQRRIPTVLSALVEKPTTRSPSKPFSTYTHVCCFIFVWSLFNIFDLKPSLLTGVKNGLWAGLISHILIMSFVESVYKDKKPPSLVGTMFLILTGLVFFFTSYVRLIVS